MRTDQHARKYSIFTRLPLIKFQGFLLPVYKYWPPLYYSKRRVYNANYEAVNRVSRDYRVGKMRLSILQEQSDSTSIIYIILHGLSFFTTLTRF